MTSIDQQFVEFIVKSLVSNPDDVVIDRTIDEKGVLLKLEVAGEDLGRVIGKRGATAQSIRTLLRALGTKNDARYNLKIVDTGEGVPPPPKKLKDESKPEESSNDSQNDETPEQEQPDQAEKETKEDLSDLDGEIDSNNSSQDVDPDRKERSFAEKQRDDLKDLDDLDI